MPSSSMFLPSRHIRGRSGNERETKEEEKGVEEGSRSSYSLKSVLGTSPTELGRKRASSEDRADARGLAHSVFSFLTATARAQSKRFDEFDDDVDEDYGDDGDDYYDDETSINQNSGASSPGSIGHREGSPIGGVGRKEPKMPGVRHKLSMSSTASEEREEEEEAEAEAEAEAETEGGVDETGASESTGENQCQLSQSVQSLVVNSRQSRSKSPISEDALKRNSAQVQKSRALALTDKLRQQLGVSADDILIGGKQRNSERSEEQRVRAEPGRRRQEKTLTSPDYPCWLLKDILLQGHLYVTSRHACFFAYLPRNQTDTIKSGSLKKKSRKTPSFSRFWFVLRNDSFSYYTNATELYFPAGTIDLRYAIKAEVVGTEKEKAKSSAFTIITETRTYNFRADSAKAAHEWVKSLQKEIFRSRNEGDCVKISIPLVNIIDLEESSILNLAITLKIRAIDSDETYAVDEYVLAFFQKAGDVVDAIKKSMKELGVSGVAVDESGSGGNDQDLASGKPVLGEVRENRPKLLKTESSFKAAPTVVTTPPKPGVAKTSIDTIKRTASSANISKKVKNLFNDNTHGSVHSNDGSTTPGSPHLSPRLIPIKGVSPRESLRELRLDSSNRSKASPAGSHNPHPELSASAARAALEHDRERKSNEELTEKSRSLAAVFDDMDLESGNSSGSEDNRNYDFLSNSESTQPQYEDKKKKKPANIVNKVTDMWGGGRKHFRDPTQAGGFRDDRHLVSEEDGAESNERFRAHFSLGETDNLVATYYCHIQKAIPIYGKMYLSNDHLCFRSLLPGTSTKMILPLSDVENVIKEKGFRFGYSGLVTVVHGHEEIFFEFGSSNNRDDCEIMILREMDRCKSRSIIRESGSAAGSLGSIGGGDYALRSARLITYEDALRNELPGVNVPPVILNHCGNDEDSEEFFTGRAKDSLRFTLLTIGSRGDVQPYISLGKGLMKEGHKVKIATHLEFKPWIEKHGIEFAEVAGDPAALMQIMIEHGMFSVSFLREAAARFRDWIDELLNTAWIACQDTDVLIESPSAMAGIHIAEALGIPYLRAFTMPWTRTRAYPHAFIVPEQKMGGSYNYLTYVMFDNVFWKGISGQVNRWRKKTLHLPRTNLDILQQTRVPFMYNVSPNILVPPVDFPSWIRVTGYWFLDEGGSDYKPAEELVNFIAKARKDKAKLVYIGFGSIVVSNPKELTKAVVASVQKSGVRCILSKGWSDRLGKGDASVPEVELPPEIYQIQAAPHDWLFPQVDAAVHHGGSGTTGASLRAGLPTIIKPFFGDQFFYAGRVEDLGAGVHLRKLTVNQFSKALWEVTHNERIISKAADIGRKIRAENGVENAIQIIYQELEYARSLIKDRNVQPIPRRMPTLMDVAGLPVKLVQRVGTAPLQSLTGVKDEKEDRIKVSSSEDDSHTDGSWTVVDS